MCVRAAYYVTCPIVLMCEKQGDFYYARQREGVKSSSHSCCLLCALHERKYKKSGSKLHFSKLRHRRHIRTAADNCSARRCKIQYFSLSHLIHATYRETLAACVENARPSSRSLHSLGSGARSACGYWLFFNLILYACVLCAKGLRACEHWHNFFNSKA